MASIRLVGVLEYPDTTMAANSQVRLTHKTTTGNVIKGFPKVVDIDSLGQYDFSLSYGNVLIETRAYGVASWTPQGIVTVNSDSTATSLPELLNATIPPTDSQLLEFQQILAEAKQAQTDALQAKTDTESLFNNFDASVADSVSRVGAFEPDVYIPFNDSLEIVRGYGTHDQIDVSAAQDGSTMVDLPSKSVDFSRASGRTVINKSGELVTLGVDEPAISSDGLGIYGTYTNKLLWSEDFSAAGWYKPAGLTVTQDGTLSSDGISQAWLLEGKLSTPLQQTVPATTDGTQYLFYHEVKMGSSSLARVRWVELGGGTVVDKQSFINLETGVITGVSHDYIGVNYLNNGWWAVWCSNATNNTGNTAVRIDIGTGEASGSIYASHAMIVESAPSGKVPYIKTESTPVTSSLDVVSIPMRNNMPAAGQPFTICCDVAFPLGGIFTAFGIVTSLGASDPRVFLLRRAVGSDDIQFYYDDADGSDRVTVAAGVDNSMHRFTCVYDGATTTRLFVDGALKGANSSHGEKSHDGFNFIRLGRWFGLTLNSTIKNFEIYHRALTDDEIKAKGAAK